MENPMNKWMIWGYIPLFFGNTQFFSAQLLKKRSKKRIYTLSSLKLRVVQELFFVGGKDLNCGRCVDFLLGVFFSLGSFLGLFWIWDLLDDQSDHFAWEVKFSSGSTEDFSCFYTKISICSPQNACIKCTFTWLSFLMGQHGSSNCPHFFPADFRVVPLGRREAWQTTEPQGTKNMIQSDHLPSRELTYCST